MQKQLKEKIKNKLMTEYLKAFSDKEFAEEIHLRGLIEKIFKDIRTRENITISNEEEENITKELIEDIIGFGPIETILKDPRVSEIMINGPHKIYVERSGRTEVTDLKFDNEKQLMYIIQKMLMPTRRRVDETSPFTDLRLADGSRVNIIIPPVSTIGPVVTIRKFSKEIKQIEDLIRLNTLDKRMAEFLIAAIKAKINIIFSGPTGSGKTTTLNVLSSYIPESERIITIEDTSELILNQEHWIPLEAKQAGIEGKGEITIRDLFKNSLRMRPDRIVIGEIRSGEGLDMLQAICSGHSGTLSIIHANSAADVIYRLETMILTSEGIIGLEGIRRQIAASINLIVHQQQGQDGIRRITQISEIRGIHEKDILMEDIFIFETEGIGPQGNVLGRWKASGVKPLFLPKFKKMGIFLSEDIFNRD
ncbi:MAG: CpaF family protein [Candidatus Omnitrophica bacterium]|nr:CpaF family protein [Candidatus Omnitrophota bacterium]